MTDEDAITEAIECVQRARVRITALRLHRLRTTENLALDLDALLESLEVCLGEMQIPLTPTLVVGRDRLSRAVPATLRQVADRIARYDEDAAVMARGDILDAARRAQIGRDRVGRDRSVR